VRAAELQRPRRRCPARPDLAKGEGETCRKPPIAGDVAGSAGVGGSLLKAVVRDARSSALLADRRAAIASCRTARMPMQRADGIAQFGGLEGCLGGRRGLSRLRRSLA
jgi:hypothetical protein